MYVYTNETPIFMGWKVVSVNRENQDDNTLFLTSQTKKKSVPYVKIVNELTTTRSTPYYNESSLIQKLEEIGIGRPSTFASLVTTLIDRNYVEKTNIGPTLCEYTQYVLKDDNITTNNTTKELCGEKNKLKSRILVLYVMNS
jgi:DNA topoisomerase IA